MASIQSIQDVLKTYQQAYGADALQAQLSLFMKSSIPSSSSSAAAAAPSSAKSDSPLFKLTNQELRDIWADLTGRPKGIKSSGKLAKKEDLVAEIERLWSAPSSEPAAAAPEVKKEKKKREGPSAWNAFVEHVSGKGKEETPEFSAWKISQTEKKGNLRFSFASSLGKEAFEQFKSTYVPVSSASSVAASSDGDAASSAPSVASSEKKKAGRPKMSEEEKAAKKQAKKEAKKAAKQAEKAAKKAAALPPLPESDQEDDTAVVYTEVQIGDQTFFWDENEGILYTKEEDGSFEACGHYDGITISFSG